MPAPHSYDHPDPFDPCAIVCKREDVLSLHTAQLEWMMQAIKTLAERQGVVLKAEPKPKQPPPDPNAH